MSQRAADTDMARAFGETVTCHLELCWQGVQGEGMVVNFQNKNILLLGLKHLNARRARSPHEIGCVACNMLSDYMVTFHCLVFLAALSSALTHLHPGP